MSRTREELETQNLEELFERFRQCPDGYAFVPLADACRKMGRIDEALDICAAGVKKHPAYPSAHVVLGKCLYDGGNRAAAREAFERVLLLDEHNLVALKYLGMIEADDGNLSAAEVHLRKILSFDPENKEIKSILHIVKEQSQIERSSEEPVTTMAAVDEILGDVSLSPEPEEENEDETAPALSIEADLGTPGAAGAGSISPRSEDVETSDELASVTLADIFAEQGYTSKAAKIYREVLRKEPGNDAVRQKLRALTGESPEPAEPEASVSEAPQELPEIAVCALPAETANAPAAGAVPRENPAADAPVPVQPAAPEAKEPADPDTAAESAVRVPAGARPEIAEKESLNHFRHWLTKLRR